MTVTRQGIVVKISEMRKIQACYSRMSSIQRNITEESGRDGTCVCN